MSTKIIGNQIDATTRAIMEALQITEQLNLPNLNQTQVTALGTPAYGTVVYNSTEDAAQIYKQDAQQGVPGWTTIGGGGPSVGNNSIIRTNGPIIEENLTVGPTANGGAEFTNGFSGGPITIANGYTVTIENGANWNIIGGDDMSLMEVNDIITTDFTAHGVLEYSETRENITFYNSSGNVTHDFNNNNTIWVTKTGGGNWTLSLNNLPTESAGYGITVIVEDSGGNGIPSSLNINGTGETIQWVGGSAPGHNGGEICVIAFSIIKKSPQGQTVTWTVLGSGSNYAN